MRVPTQQARELWSKETKAERAASYLLRNRLLGAHFRRQHARVVDFFCKLPFTRLSHDGGIATLSPTRERAVTLISTASLGGLPPDRVEKLRTSGCRPKGRRYLRVVLLLFISTMVAPAHESWSGAERRSAALLFAAWVVPPEAEQGFRETREEIYRWMNFLLLAGALVYLGRRPLAEFFAQRSSSVRKALEEGRKALENSLAQLSAVEAKLLHLEEEIAAFKASATREMESDRQRLREAAAGEAERITESARTQMELALRSAKLELRIQAAQQAVELAEQMIRERLDDAGRSRLVSRFITGLKNSG